jgi:hypothetical protein
VAGHQLQQVRVMLLEEICDVVQPLRLRHAQELCCCRSRSYC